MENKLLKELILYSIAFGTSYVLAIQSIFGGMNGFLIFNIVIFIISGLFLYSTYNKLKKSIK